MSLITYKDVRPWASSIEAHGRRPLMPPWTADPRTDTSRRSTAERRRNRHDRALVESGAREGDPEDLPPAPSSRKDGRSASPTSMFEMPTAFDDPGEGVIPLQSFEVPTNFKEDMWMQAAEARYGDAPHVHHIVVSVIPPPERSKA